MAFCRYCGKELKEGEICSCQISPAPENVTTHQEKAASDSMATSRTEAASDSVTASQAEADPKTAGTYRNSTMTASISSLDKEMVHATAKRVLHCFKSIIKKPAAEGKDFVVKGDRMVSLCFIAIQACLSAIFSMLVVGKLNKVMDLGGKYLSDYKFSMIKAFFITVVFSFLFSLLMVLLFRTATLILKVKTDWNQMLALAAVRSIALLPLILAGYIFFLINPGVGICIFYGSGMLAICFMLAAVRGIEGIDSDKAVYTVFVVAVVFMLISGYIASKAIVLYFPSALRNTIQGGLSGILEQLL